MGHLEHRDGRGEGFPTRAVTVLPVAMAVVAMLACIAPASAGVIVQFTFHNGTAQTYEATTVASFISATAYNTNANNKALVSEGSPSNSVSSNGYDVANKYYYFDLTVQPGYKLTMTNFTYSYRVDSSGITNYDVRYSTNAFSTSTSIGSGTPSKSNSTWYSATASTGMPISGLTGTVNFRLYGSGASNSGKSWLNDNVTVYGDTQARASLATAVTAAPAAKVFTGATGVQCVLTTTNNALTGGTITAAEQLSYTLSFASQNGLSFATTTGSNLDRGASATNIINVNTATSGAKSGVLSAASNAWTQSLASLPTVQVYQRASLSATTDKAELRITNAAANDGAGAQRAAARITAVTLIDGDPMLGMDGIGVGTVVLSGTTVVGDASVSGPNPLNGTYTGTFQVAFENADQTIVGTSTNDLGTLQGTVTKTITNKKGSQKTKVNNGRHLGGLSSVSDMNMGTTAALLDGVSTQQQTEITTSWYNAVLGEGPAGQNLLSDKLDFGGTDGDTFVLQMGYQGTPLAGPAALVWMNSQNQWVNAVAGNSGGTPHFAGDGPYDPNTDFHLGYYGVDTSAHTVWAVLNHNSRFAAVPEPGTISLLVGGLIFAGLRRRRR